MLAGERACCIPTAAETAAGAGPWLAVVAVVVAAADSLELHKEIPLVLIGLVVREMPPAEEETPQSSWVLPDHFLHLRPAPSYHYCQRLPQPCQLAWSPHPWLTCIVR